MIKNCQSCNTKFDGRRDAKTCSVRCRKRFQRAKLAILHEAGVIKQDVEQAIDTLKGDIIPVRLVSDVDANVPDEAGFIALEEQKQPFADSAWKPNYLDLPSAPNQLAKSPPKPSVVPGNTPSVAVLPRPIQTPTAAAPTPVPRPTVQPAEPKILSLENTPMVSEASSAILSPLTTPLGARPPATVPQTRPYGPTSPVTAPPDDFQEEVRLWPKLRIYFKKNIPLVSTIAAAMVLILLGGVFAGTKLINQSDTGVGVANTQSGGVVNQDNSVLNINIDTVLASGKKLTLGQIVAGPGTNVLQVTGDVQSTGTLLASGGGSSLNNSGLRINNVVVCTSAGCNSGAVTNLASALNNVTRQGNVFNGNSQLVQLTTTGALPTLSGASLINLNASNISLGNLNDARLSANVALLDTSQTFTGNPLFKNVADSTTAFSIQNAAGTNLILVDTSAGSVTVVGLQGSGANLTNLNASNISSGILTDARLSSNVALLNGTGPQVFTGNNKFSGTLLFQNSANSATALQIQNSAGTSNLLVADTTSTQIGVGKAPTLGTLDVNGNIYQSGNQVCDSSGNCPSSGNITQGGNSFGTALTLGTNDNFGFNLETNNTTVASLTNSGAALFKNASDSTTAFQIQKADATPLLVVDTSNSRIAIGPSGLPANSALTVGTNTTASSGGVYLGTDTNLYRSGASTLATDSLLQVGSGNIQFNAANSNNGIFWNTSSNGVGVSNWGSIRRVSANGNMEIDPQTDSNLILQANANGNVGIGTTNVSALLQVAGTGLFKNLSNSATAFQIQNATASPLFVADTTGMKITINGSLALNAHIITGNSSGSTTVAAGVASICTLTSPTVNITGNDTAGQVSITTATGACSAGILATVSFANSYGSAPRIGLTAANSTAAGIQYYNGTSGVGSFTIDTATNPVVSTTYIYNYWVAQ